MRFLFGLLKFLTLFNQLSRGTYVRGIGRRRWNRIGRKILR